MTENREKDYGVNLSLENAINLRLLVDMEYDILRPSKKSLEDKRDALGNGHGSTSEIFNVLLSCLEELSNSVNSELVKVASNMPIVKEATRVKGCQLAPVARVIAYIPNPEKFHSVAALWSYTGFSVNDTSAEELSMYHRKAKAAVYDLAGRLIGGNLAYYKLYKKMRARYLKRGFNEGHADVAAKRVVAKTWLSHLYETARELTGMQTSVDKAIERYGDDVRLKETYGWK